MPLNFVVILRDTFERILKRFPGTYDEVNASCLVSAAEMRTMSIVHTFSTYLIWKSFWLSTLKIRKCTAKIRWRWFPSKIIFTGLVKRPCMRI